MIPLFYGVLFASFAHGNSAMDKWGFALSIISFVGVVAAFGYYVWQRQAWKRPVEVNYVIHNEIGLDDL
jgi:hypothetical protein